MATYTDHQIKCVQKFCNEVCAGPQWTGCTFPHECLHVACKPEVDGGLALALRTPEDPPPADSAVDKGGAP